jgi:hypothetical protein
MVGERIRTSDLTVPNLRLDKILVMQSGSTKFRPACTGQPVFCFSMSVLDQADNSRRLVNADDDSDVSSFSTHIQLCSAGFLVEFEVTAFHSRFTD